MKTVTFENPRGERLVGLLHGTPDDTLVICCHGMLSTKDGPKHVQLAERLHAAEMPAFRFDFAGRGESEGSLFDLTYSHQKDDLLAAIEHFAGLGVERFGLFGSSMGGAVALLAAAREERVVAVATLAAVGHPEALEERFGNEVREWRERGYIDIEGGRIGLPFLEDALSHDVLSAVGVLRAPIYVLHGGRDEVLPVSDADDIASAARKAQLEIIDDADHRFSDPQHLEVALTNITQFFVEHL